MDDFDGSTAYDGFLLGNRASLLRRETADFAACHKMLTVVEIKRSGRRGSIDDQDCQGEFIQLTIS
jgi:hypothetical protein